MSNNQIKYSEIQICDQNEVFASKEEMRSSLTRLCYGDLYIIGRIWIDALKTGLVGSEFSLIPVVEAAKPPPPPEKPPLMRYKDLPLYKSPHYEYKDYIADKDKCPKANVKLAQAFLLPYVTYFRTSLQESTCEFRCELNGLKKDICCALKKKQIEFIHYMRCPKNLQLRQGVVTLGGLVGLYLARARGIPTKIFCSGFGLLATGALCFPKETDQAFRNISYYTGKTTISIYNFYCNKMFGMRERVPCAVDLPPPPPNRNVNKCPEKK